MRLRRLNWLSVFLLLIPVAFAASPQITSINPVGGAVGTQVQISGSGFGATQGGSTISLAATNAAVASWSDTSIVAVVPVGELSGVFAVSVNGQTASSSIFTAAPLPLGWSDGDIGTTGVAGRATYANGTFTVKGAGSQIYGPQDAFHFLYQPLSGDGTIVARVVSMQGNASLGAAGVMVRETLDPASANAKTADWPAYSGIYFDVRGTAGGGTSEPGSVTSVTLPYWVKVARSGNTFSSYYSPDGANWTPLGIPQTASMAQSVYMGLAVTSGSTSALATALFDNVSINSAASTAPVIAGVSATTGPIGSQVAITGSGFGASANGSAITLNGYPVTINSWSATSIAITIPMGATSGVLQVAAAPGLNCSNGVMFGVTSQPLPSGWLDQDVGAPGLTGSATYASANGVFTVQAAGPQIYSGVDAFHFVYQPLNGDGAILARLVSVQGNASYGTAGVMFRETMSSASANAKTADWPAYNGIYFDMRATAGGGTSEPGSVTSITLPYWVKMARNGNTFSSYYSSDGVNWNLLGPAQTINMAASVYLGLAVNSGSASALATAVFDNVSIASGHTPVIAGVSPSSGLVGSSVTVTGTYFGAAQGSSVIRFNGSPAAVSSWSDTQIVATVPVTASTGPVQVVVNNNASNGSTFTVPQPFVSYYSPTGGASGTQVTINGAYFQPTQRDSTVTFNGVVAPIVSWSDTQIIAAVPATASTGPMQVSVNGTRSYAGNIFEVPHPAISSITPPEAPVGGQITVYGSGFGILHDQNQPGVQVTINGLAMPTGAWSDTSIIALVPAHAVSGPITVTRFGVTSSGVSFTVEGVPTVTGLAPAKGPVGATVMVNGSGFGSVQSSSTLQFNGATASITSWGDTQ
ncbi:MAG TPA: IPT/TIG domain-containing protein, partial [Candidatus Saccharimonadales bacterium]|nr:IPT/TIG domain-containing protein [Candidatus Saccharimonadales bacterium]